MLILLGIGIFGLLGLSVLCPVIAIPAYYFLGRRWIRKRAVERSAPMHPLQLDVLIPAHNEAERIGGTLRSIQESVRYVQTRVSGDPPPRVNIRVGADSCTDQTTEIAQQSPVVSL